METRKIYCDIHNHLLAEITFPAGTSESKWQSAVEGYACTKAIENKEAHGIKVMDGDKVKQSYPVDIKIAKSLDEVVKELQAKVDSLDVALPVDIQK